MSKKHQASEREAKILQFSQKKPRPTPSDIEDMKDARRLLALRRAGSRLLGMHRDLQEVFTDVVRHDQGWPFFSIRRVQAYVEVSDFHLMTRNPNLLNVARIAVEEEMAGSMTELSKSLLADAGLSLTAVSGIELRKDPYALKNNEQKLNLIREVIADSSPEEQEAIARVARVTQHSLRTMYNLGGTLSETGQAMIRNLGASAEIPSIEEDDPSYVSPRRHYLRLGARWLHVCTKELQLMKLNLLADFAESSSGRKIEKESCRFEGQFIQATGPQRDFIKTHAQSHRDLHQASDTLRLAVLH